MRKPTKEERKWVKANKQKQVVIKTTKPSGFLKASMTKSRNDFNKKQTDFEEEKHKALALISQVYPYCNTIADFKLQLAVQKKQSSTFIAWLTSAEINYRISYNYYLKYGLDNGSNGRMELDKQILDRIRYEQSEIVKQELSNEPKPKAQAKDENKKQASGLELIWSDSKTSDLLNKIALLVTAGYIDKNDDQSYQWKGKGWKKLAAITEIWKNEKLLKPKYLLFGAQRDLCMTVCRYFNIDKSKHNSVYNTGFKESVIATDNKLNKDVEKLVKEISSNLTK